MKFRPFTSPFVLHEPGSLGIPKDFHPELKLRNFDLMRMLLFRQTKSMNTFIIVVGSPRTSKSYFAMKIAELYSEYGDKKFDVEKQLSFDLKPFIEWSQEATDSIFILDEIGVNLSPDQWWDIQSRIMRRFTQIQGFRSNVLLMVCPSVIFLQKSFRFLSSFGVETVAQGLVKWYKINMRQLHGKGYLNYMGHIKFSEPSKETLEKYEAMKKEFNDKMLAEDLEYLRSIDPEFQKQEEEQKELKVKEFTAQADAITQAKQQKRIEIKTIQIEINKLKNVVATSVGPARKDAILKKNELRNQLLQLQIDQ